MRSKNGWVLLIMLLSGIVLGGFIGMLTANVSGLSWLNYGQSFGLENPIVLDLGLLILTFGLTIHISIGQHPGRGDRDYYIPEAVKHRFQKMVVLSLSAAWRAERNEYEYNNHERLYKEERPYEKCVKAGAAALSDAELLAVVMRTGTRGKMPVSWREGS